MEEKLKELLELASEMEDFIYDNFNGVEINFTFKHLLIELSLLNYIYIEGGKNENVD